MHTDTWDLNWEFSHDPGQFVLLALYSKWDSDHLFFGFCLFDFEFSVTLTKKEDYEK